MMSVESTSRPMTFDEVLLGDVVTLQRGFDITKAEQTLGVVPIVSSSGISSFHNKWKVRAPGVVIGRKGTLGTVHYLAENFWPHDTTLWVKDFKGGSPRFVSYFLRTLRLENFDTGSSNPTLNRNHVHKIRVQCPDGTQHKKIAAVLAAYDDMIENNRQRIALLERMAEQLYREWFVRFRFPDCGRAKFEKGIPVGWRVAKLSEVADINARSIKKGREPELIRYLDISSVTTNAFSVPTEIKYRDAPGRARRVLRHGDVIWASVRPANRAYCLVLNPEENLVASTGFAVISPREGMPFSFIKFAVTSDSFVEQMTAVAKGSAYPATSFEDFGNASVLLPTPKLLAKFHEHAMPMLMLAHRLGRQTETLTNARDLLLPRLISGKLRVDDLDIQFPPSMQDAAA